jgi:hypothetical protein
MRQICLPLLWNDRRHSIPARAGHGAQQPAHVDSENSSIATMVPQSNRQALSNAGELQSVVLFRDNLSIAA